jgi:GNAT superfamily N-acetyltransferase
LCDRGRVEVRPRVDADLVACERLVQVVHVHDGYPVYLPGDLGAFLAEPDALAHWVAVEGGEVVGHVALHPGGSVAMMDLATEKTGIPASEFGVVARLLVSPTARRLGIGRSLLDRAEASALRLGRRPILEVVDRHASAVRLYESRGWRCLGQITVTFGGDVPINEFVFIGPGSAGT